MRFVNKIQQSTGGRKEKIYGYFDHTDIEIISYSVQYLGLVIQRYLEKQMHEGILSQLSHESVQPCKDIIREIERWTDKRNSAVDSIKDADDYVTFIEKRGYNVLQIISDMAELMRNQAAKNMFWSDLESKNKKHKFAPESVDIGKLIQRATRLVKPMARYNNLRFANITHEIAGPLLQRTTDAYAGECRLLLDPCAFELVFYNLLTNAIKYHKPENKGENGTFAVEIEVGEGKHCKNQQPGIIITVSDNGMGIPEDEQDKIFEFGNRGSMAKKKVKGFGIGLYSVREIIKAVGGEIRVANCINPTKFEIWLPNKIIDTKRRWLR